MAWITQADVAAVYPAVTGADDFDALIDHVQALAEIEIGTQTEPVTSKLKAVTVDITYRAWRARKAGELNPAGYQSEAIDEYSYQLPQGPVLEAGFGLTNREITRLRKAVGETGLWVQPTTRGPLETAPSHHADDDWFEGAL